MANKELDKLIENYFATTRAPSVSVSFDMLVEMIQETIEDSYPDITSRSDPAGFDTNINPEMIATKVPPGAENDRPTIERVVAQVMGAPDPAMVDSVMLHFDDPQGLATRGSPSSGGGNIAEGRLPPEQWKELYRQLLMVGVDSDMVEAIKMLADSGMSKDDLQAMLTQQAMQDARGMQQMNEEEKKTGRFSYKINIPALVPSEAWGDPKHMSRKSIDRVFNVIRKLDTMQKSIALVNSFIDPQQAARKAPKGRFHTVINMMQIIEALQATLNDYTESSAGFVFEGFMAALTGGKQIDDRIGGTLPIEDFKTFNDEQVSLKLLSPGTNIHGSFTNLLDYLYIREGGNAKIKYLIAYKNSKGDDVSELLIYDFVITQENFAAVMQASGNADKFGDSLQPVTIGKIKLPALPDLLAEYTKGGTDEWRAKMKMLLTHGTELSPGKDGKPRRKAHVPGYTPAGMFYNDDIVTSAGGMLAPDEADAASEADKARLAAKKKGEYHKRSIGQFEIAARKEAKESAAAGVPEEEAWTEFLANHEDLADALRPSVEDDADAEKVKKANASAKRNLSSLRRKFADAYEGGLMNESYFGSFYEREKIFLREQQLLVESGKKSKEDAGSQWSISGPAMMKMTNLMDTTFYGELNLSAENIDKCADIYIDKMKGDMIVLLDTTKAFTENVGKYFGEADRDKASDFAQAAKDNADIVTSKLSADMDADPNTKK